MTTHHNCEGLQRRDCLKLGLGALLGGGFVDALRLRTNAEQKTARKTSCILVWLDGGPSHFETFDPKPDAPAEIRGEFSTIQTKIPGVNFSENMTKLAAISDKLTIVRSVRHDQNNHGAGNHYMTTGSPTRIPVGCGAFVSFHPSMGSVTSAERGAPAGLPPYFSLPDMTRSGGPNFLGARHAPFVVADDPNHAAFRVRDVTIPQDVADGRALTRRELRTQMDGLLRFQDRSTGDPVLGVDENFQQAISLMTSPAALAAFEIQRESPLVRDTYGRSAFGQRALLARRLVEAGVPFVTLNNGGWDHHSGIFPAFKKQGQEFESVVATLIEDLDQRGMLDDTLVVAVGEFGRSPQRGVSTSGNGNSDDGRDHWPYCYTAVMAGAGVRRGYVHGKSDKTGSAPLEDAVHPNQLLASIYHNFGIHPETLVYNHLNQPRELVKAEAITKLFA